MRATAAASTQQLLARRRSARLRVLQPRCLGGDHQSTHLFAAKDLLCNLHGIAQHSLRLGQVAEGTKKVGRSRQACAGGGRPASPTLTG